MNVLQDTTNNNLAPQRERRGAVVEVARKANYGDIPGIVALMIEMYKRSIYRQDCEFDEREAKALLVRSIQRHGGRQDGSTFVFVAEREDVVQGFIIAALSRLYGIGTKLGAADTHFYVSGRAHARDAFKLIAAYEAWATENEQVIEINLCATDAVGEFERTEKLYRRLGFEPFGVVLSKRVNTVESGDV